MQSRISVLDRRLILKREERFLNSDRGEDCGWPPNAEFTLISDVGSIFSSEKTFEL